MRLWRRLFWVVLRALCQKDYYPVTAESVLRFRVLPWDCVWRFVGNDRYHAFMDLSRIDIIVRTGWWRVVLKNRWAPFVRMADIRFRAPLGMFQKFTLRTRIIYWDEYGFWLEHIFESKGRVVASAISRNVTRKSRALVTTTEALRSIHNVVPKPPCSEKVRATTMLEELLRRR